MVKISTQLKCLEKVISELESDKISIQKAQTIINAADKQLKTFSLYLAACKANGKKPDMELFNLK